MAFNLFGKKKKVDELNFPESPVPVSQVLNMKAQGMTNAQIANQLRAQGYSLSQIRDALSQAEIKSAVAPPQNVGDIGGMPNLPDMPGAPQAPNQNELPPLPPAPTGNSPELNLPPLPEVPPTPGLPATPQPQAPQQHHQQNTIPQQIPQTTISHNVPPGMEGLVDELQRIIEDIIEEKWKDVDKKVAKLDEWKAKVDEKVSELSSRVSELNKRVDDFAKTLASKTEEYKETMNNVNTEMEALEKVMGKLVPGLAEEIKELRHLVEKIKKK